MLTIEFNGETRQIADGSTIADVLRQSGVELRFCAVEVNLEIVTKDNYSKQRISDGDRIEVVTLVGGG